MSLIAPTLQSFFADRLVNQRQASPRTIASYRDSLKLLIAFVHAQTGKTPSLLDWEDLGPEITSAPSWTTFKGRAATVHGPAICGSRLSGRCSSMRHCATPNMAD